MALSSKQKIFASVLALSVAGLMTDRAFLGPNEVAAQESTAAHNAATLQTSVAETANADRTFASALSTPKSTIADRLETIADAQALDLTNIPNAFQPSPAWMPDEPSPESPALDSASAESFRAAHRLTAVLADGTRGYALVDGRCLLIGEALDGFTLIGVSDGSAVLESDRTRVELTLPGVAGGSGSQ